MASQGQASETLREQESEGRALGQQVFLDLYSDLGRSFAEDALECLFAQLLVEVFCVAEGGSSVSPMLKSATGIHAVCQRRSRSVNSGE